MNDFGAMVRPIAAKQHSCWWCGRQIEKGEKHYHYSGMWQGDWQDWRMHNECYEQYEKEDDYGEGFALGEGEPPKRLLSAEELEDIAWNIRASKEGT